MEFMQAEIVSLVSLIIVSLVGIVTQKAVAYLNAKGVIVKIENNKELANIVIKAIQQSYNHLDGNEKLNVAKSELLRFANEKNIKISEHEMDLLIESSVKEMKDSVKISLNK